MFRFDVPSDAVEVATRMSDAIGVQEMSVTNGDGQAAGFLGKVITMAMFGGTPCDIRVADYLVNGHTMEVKVTRCDSVPRADYKCNMFDHSATRSSEFLTFVRILNNLSAGWVMAITRRDKFFEVAERCVKGQKDPSFPRFVFKHDCWAAPALVFQSVPDNLREEWKSGHSWKRFISSRVSVS